MTARDSGGERVCTIAGVPARRGTEYRYIHGSLERYGRTTSTIDEPQFQINRVTDYGENRLRSANGEREIQRARGNAARAGQSIRSKLS